MNYVKYRLKGVIDISDQISALPDNLGGQKRKTHIICTAKAKLFSYSLFFSKKRSILSDSAISSSRFHRSLIKIFHPPSFVKSRKYCNSTSKEAYKVKRCSQVLMSTPNDHQATSSSLAHTWPKIELLWPMNCHYWLHRVCRTYDQWSSTYRPTVWLRFHWEQFS